MNAGNARWRASTLAVAVGFATALAACSGGGSPSPVSGDGGAAVSGSTPSPTAGDWTTLGTRGAVSTADRPITANAAAQWVDYNPPATYPGVKTLPMQFITMPDGTQLATYVTLPADASGQAVTTPLPTVLIQTAYNGGSAGMAVSALGGADPYIVEHGYATVVVDVRGTGQSSGNWEAFGADEQSDYGHVVDWVTQQPFSNGVIGVYGVSYLGITAIITAAQDHPAVKAAFPIVPIGDGYRDIVFTGGQVNPTFMPLWLVLVTGLGVANPCVLTDPTACLPTVTMHILSALTKFQVPTLLNALLGSPGTIYDGDFWATRSPLENDGKVNVPTFIVGGLHDLFQRSEPMTYEAIKNQAVTKLLIGPWTHLQAALGDGLPEDGVPLLDHIELQWFDQYLKGMDVGADRLPNVTQYVAGYGHYVTAVDWPNPQAQAERLYLQPDRTLASAAPTGSATPLMFPALPLEGLCSISGSQWTAGILGYTGLPCFSYDTVADAATTVNFELPAPSGGLYLNGPIEADLWISSNARDAQLSVRVDDVGPDGRAKAITNGIQIASQRAVDDSRSRTLDGQRIQPWHPYTQASAQPLTPGTPTEVAVEIFSTSAWLAPGHTLRIAVGASDLPQGLPPLPTLLNTLGSATTSLYTDAAHPSSVVLPVVPTSALGG